ncbi:hypothetical protein DFJ74DRAFT_708020 [Hyaloraphidium curvatum]|nr:hypothetical protein DFJ74DRAFT_708020 [Hyaloraphidium curvatum]
MATPSFLPPTPTASPSPTATPTPAAVAFDATAALLVRFILPVLLCLLVCGALLLTRLNLRAKVSTESGYGPPRGFAGWLWGGMADGGADEGGGARDNRAVEARRRREERGKWGSGHGAVTLVPEARVPRAAATMAPGEVIRMPERASVARAATV